MMSGRGTGNAGELLKCAAWAQVPSSSIIFERRQILSG